MAKRNVEIGIDIDSREAVRNLSKVADEAREVEDALDDDVTSAAQAVADAMERSAADMIAEIDATRRAVDALDAALGDTDVDTTKVVGDLKKIGLTAEDIEGEALAALVVNKLRGIMNVVAVKAPGFGDRRKAMLEDIAILTGGRCITEDLGIKLEQLVDCIGVVLCLVLAFYGFRETVWEFEDGTLPDKDLRIANWYMMSVFTFSFVLLATEFMFRLRRAAKIIEDEASGASEAGF